MMRIEPVGLDYWMDGVIRQCEHLRQEFAPDPVHDLRVALRRCRSMADGFMAVDPHPAWALMKSAGKTLFRQLGALRDIHVMLEWTRRLAPEPDEVSLRLCRHLESQEAGCRKSAADALWDFDRKKWDAWTKLLSERARRIPPEHIVFRHLALERLAEARDLHGRALRDRSHVAYHRLRIGLKKFRYTVENFLPGRHERWGPDLRCLQDLLGEMHDLHVLWQTAVAIRAAGDDSTRARWRQRIHEEISSRLNRYRGRTMGRNSLFPAWQSELPNDEEIGEAAFARFRVWASYRDPDTTHSDRVAKLGLQIYDGLASLNLLSRDMPEARRILEAAAWAHAAGAGKEGSVDASEAWRSIRKLHPPLGWSPDILRRIALVVRFHRGPLPRPEQKALAGIPEEQRRILILLSGILRLADAFDRLRRQPIPRLDLMLSGDALRITVPGYVATHASAEKLAAARHLLEIACRRPILIR